MILNVRDKLINEVSKIQTVIGIGQTGEKNPVLIPGQSDLDLFVLCNSIPNESERKDTYNKLSEDFSDCYMSVCNGGYWGHGDILVVNTVNVMFMYFTLDEMTTYLTDVLKGRYIEKDSGFYPTGRLASIESINIFYEEDDAWTNLKNLTSSHPSSLFKQLYIYHKDRILDEENLGRALLRKDVLFYHMVLEDALDHFIQSLFALNSTYFPSRKKNEKYINAFKIQPENCYNRLLGIIKYGASEDTIEKSIRELRNLVQELERKNIFK